MNEELENRKGEFRNKVRQWADKLGVEVQWIAIRPMKTKWASCSTKGHLHFNKELLMKSGNVWDYVIVHELLHLSVPNHGRLWKSLMRAHLGDYDQAIEELRV